MPKLDWEMRVAVISTAHMPPDFDPENVPEVMAFKAVDDPSVIVYVDDLDSLPDAIRAWLEPLTKEVNLVRTNPAPYNWIRFDSIADVIDGLPTFDWS